MFRQLNKLKDKAKRVLDDLSNTLENQLSPRRQPQRIPVRVPVSNRPRASPLYRNYSTIAYDSPYKPSNIILGSLPYQSFQPLSQHSIISMIKGLRLPQQLLIFKSQKYSSYYRYRLMSSSFRTNVTKILTSFTFVKDASKYYNSLTNKYDHMGVRITINNPVENVTPSHTTVYDAVNMLEFKMNQFKESISKLKQLSKIGDLPVQLDGSKITINFENLTKPEVLNLFVDHQVNYIPVSEVQVTPGVLSDMNKSLNHGATAAVTDDIQYTVKVGLESYSLNSNDLSGESEAHS